MNDQNVNGVSPGSVNFIPETYTKYIYTKQNSTWNGSMKVDLLVALSFSEGVL